ncbi:MAG: hypothetical protein CMLOHMNK_02713 [Steroidobacteraceae bacterium]|nr:hypothetical protein [Steroidobacteraceae bacterium]
MQNESQPSVVEVHSLREYFRESVHGALARQHVAVGGETEQYVVNLLTLFARSEALFDQTPDGARIKPLVVMLTEALEARTGRERCAGLQRLGDVSLFVAGFFAQGFARKLIDIDYHIAMGGRAYGTLSDAVRGSARAALGPVFAELAAKFQQLVDALNDISESGYQHSDQDILRLYEIWLKTGSRRAGRLLSELGVTPSAGARTAFSH